MDSRPRRHGHADPDGETAAKKSGETILSEQIEEEEEQLAHHPLGIFLSALSAGLDIGFGPFLMGVMLTLGEGVFREPVTRIAMANAYSVGFVIVVLGGAVLFTEHTTLAVLPVLRGRATMAQLLRLWALIYSGNLVGAAIFAALAAVIGPALGSIREEALGEIALSLTHGRWWVVLLSGVLAGWLMGLVSWLVTSGRDTISQIVFVWLVTTGIGLAHLHHCIAGSVEVLAGVFATDMVGLLDFGRFLLWSTLGNVIGGVVFVGILKYSYVTQSRPRSEVGMRYYR